MSLPVEEVVAANGVIAAPGQLVTTFGAYPRRANSYARIIQIYVSAAAATGLRIFLVPALAAAAEDEIVLGLTTSGLQLARACYPVPTNPATGLPFILAIEKTIAGNGNVRVFWSDVEP